MDRSVFVDTSWWKAILDGRDDFHQQALDQLDEIKSGNLILVTTNYIVDEALTLIRIRVSYAKSMYFRQTLAGLAQQIKLIRVSATDELEAWKWFEKEWSKLSFTDCTSFAVMKRLSIKRAASFDQHFVRAGFALLK